MSRAETTLAQQIFAENFDGIVAQVMDFLLCGGPESLGRICRGCKLNISKVQEAVKILVQHHFVTFQHSEGPILYKANNEAVINLLRYPRYLQIAGSKLGVDAQVLVEQVIKSGEIPVSKLLFICGAEMLESTQECSDDHLQQQLNSLYHTVKLLAEFRFIIQSPELGKEEVPLSTSTGAVTVPLPNFIPNLELYAVPKVDLTDLVREVKAKEKGNVNGFPDSEIHFKLNVRKLQESTRNKLVLAALERKYRPMVDPRIFEVIIDLGFVKHPWEKESIPVSVNEVADILRNALGDTHLNKYIDEYFDVLEQDPLRIFTKLGNSFGGQFIFSMQKAFTHIMWSTIERIVTDRHGYHAARIFRLIKENSFIEQEKIQELAMIPAKEAKQLTYKLVNDKCVFVKEVRKTYSVGGVPGKVAHLFHVDLNQAVLALLEACYNAMINCKLRQKKEWMKNSQLLRKEDRINRILAKMKSQHCSDEQLKEIQELITPPQQAVLLLHQKKTSSLMSGVIHLEETIFIIQMYLHYNQKKPPPKTGRRAKQAVVDDI